MTELRILCLWIFNITWISGQNLTGENICGNKTFVTCCNDYEQVGNICVECKPGYAGRNCSLPCLPNYYGSRCRHTCDCSSSEYCDREQGCLCKETSPNCTNPDGYMAMATRDTEIITKGAVV
ncbi:scavenger receptor class F member 1-like [Ostrea edulis]|uniref:scavenger receptor class F member 1-like n=1 Tax=Ostrea edulis TaxID=37623 RepID=UPI0024AEF505|nr:scavenger receptor class F member 1-like [Ostrea edulis]